VSSPVVLKFGGELLEDSARMQALVASIAGIAKAGAPLTIVHGGGKEIDAALKGAGIEKRQVDGLRITDAATLNVVVAVLAGTINTRFVAALNAAGVPAVVLARWENEEGASDAFLQELHRQLQNGRAPHEAELKARQAVRRSSGWAAPFYWSGWIGIGQ